jgi:hypothetical protein
VENVISFRRVRIVSTIQCAPFMTGSLLITFGLGPLTTFGDVCEQDINERVLPIERRAACIFRANDALDGRHISLAESVVFGTKEAFPSSRGLARLDPLIQDAAAYKGFDRLIPGSAV